jgi:hypothetical protein
MAATVDIHTANATVAAMPAAAGVRTQGFDGRLRTNPVALTARRQR